MRKYTYQSEKLSVARSCLMLPHTLGEAQSIADVGDGGCSVTQFYVGTAW